MRRAVPFAILAGCLGVGVLPAFAADTQVSASTSSWVPKQFAVKPGEQVTWRNASGVVHNLTVDGTPVVMPGSASWTYGPQSYPARSTPYEYHCSLHYGMSGQFYVNASGTVPAPTASPTASPTAPPTGSPTPYPSGSPAPGGPAPSPGSTGSGVTVSSFRARAARSRFCTSRSAACRKPGVFLLIDLRASEPVRLRGTLKRGARRVRPVSIRVRPGHRRVRLPGRRLKPGRYTLTLRAGDITRRLRFRVRAS